MLGRVSFYRSATSHGHVPRLWGPHELEVGGSAYLLKNAYGIRQLKKKDFEILNAGRGMRGNAATLSSECERF